MCRKGNNLKYEQGRSLQVRQNQPPGCLGMNGCESRGQTIYVQPNPHIAVQERIRVAPHVKQWMEKAYLDVKMHQNKNNSRRIQTLHESTEHHKYIAQITGKFHFPQTPTTKRFDKKYTFLRLRTGIYCNSNFTVCVHFPADHTSVCVGWKAEYLLAEISWRTFGQQFSVAWIVNCVICCYMLSGTKGRLQV